jgi:hypothetical protein
MNEAATRVNEPPALRILAMMEANSVTGPAKNLIGFCRWLRTPEGAQTGLKVAIATQDRTTALLPMPCVTLAPTCTQSASGFAMTPA